MSRNVPQEDQVTIKNYYYNNFKNPLTRQESYSLSHGDICTKKPLKDLLNSHSIQKLQQNNYMSIQNSQQKHSLNYFQDSFSKQFQNTDKLTQKIVEPHHDVSKYCMRLFTFMESTQKDRLDEQNKQNFIPYNFEEKNRKIKQNIVSKSPQTERQTVQLKRMNIKDHSNSQNPKDFQFQEKEKYLISFIEDSKRKRDQLLKQLQKLDFNQPTFNVNRENHSFYTARQQRKLNPSLKKVKPQSSSNSLKNQESKREFFKNKLMQNNKKTINSEDQLNLNKRRFSLVSLRKNNQTILPINFSKERPKSARNSLNFQKNDKKSSFKSIKSFKKDIKLFNTNQKLKFTNQKKKEKSHQKKKIVKKSQSKNIQRLIIKKKQLEKQLLNVNEILLFNKKKKKQSRHEK